MGKWWLERSGKGKRGIEKQNERSKVEKGRFNSLHCFIVYVNTLCCKFNVFQSLSVNRDK